MKDFWRVISACLWRRQKLPKSSTTSKTHNHSCPRVQCYEALYSTSACPRVQYYGPCTVQGMTEKKFSEMFSFSLAQLLQLRFTCPEFILTVSVLARIAFLCAIFPLLWMTRGNCLLISSKYCTVKSHFDSLGINITCPASKLSGKPACPAQELTCPGQADRGFDAPCCTSGSSHLAWHSPLGQISSSVTRSQDAISEPVLDSFVSYCTWIVCWIQFVKKSVDGQARLESRALGDCRVILEQPTVL